MKRGRFLPRPQMPAQLPPALRCFAPKLDKTQVRDLGLAHIVNLDAMVSGQANEQTLWDWMGSVLTWSRIAADLQLGVEEMEQQLHLATSIVERYGRTGRVGLSGAEYQLAKDGVTVMDLLAERVDRPTAVLAADWSEARLHAMQADHERAAA